MNKFHKFSKKDHMVWRQLFRRQNKNLKGRASRIFWEGLKLLGIKEARIPDFQKIDQKLRKISGFEIVSTPIQYSDMDHWFINLFQKKFLITEYIRDGKNLDYTPLPDIFHDGFGHLPFMASKEYTRIVEKFANKFMTRKTKREKEEVRRIWWYSYEFGLIKESGRIKVIGAGLISSFAETNNIWSGKVKLLRFNTKIVRKTPISPHRFHKKLFILESLEELERALAEFKD